MTNKTDIAVIIGRFQVDTLGFEDMEYENVLVPVYRNGELLVDYSFEDVRKMAALPTSEAY